MQMGAPQICSFQFDKLVSGDINGNQNQDRRKGTAQKSEMFRAASKANKKRDIKKTVHVSNFI